MFYFVLAVVASMALAFVCSLSEAVLLSLRHAQIEGMGQSRASHILRGFKREMDVPIAAILVLNTIANTMGAAVVGATYIATFGEKSLLFFSAGFTLAVLIFSELVPKTLGVAFPEQLGPVVAYTVRGLTLLLKPILTITRAISKLLVGGGQKPSTSLDEIRLLAALGETEGAVGARVAAIIEGAATLRELRARDVMVPRSGVIYLSGEDGLERTLEIIRQSGHSRFPFSYSGSLDQVDGVVVVKDLMFQLREGSGQPNWEELLVKPVMAPAAAPLERLLRLFQEQRRHMAVVLDEYGGTQGIVTLEDVLEEIVGEIEDESDRVNRFIVKKPDGSLVCRGWAETRKVFDLFAIDEETTSVSIGGAVAELVGRVPRVGDVVQLHGLQMRVTHASPRRAERIEVTKLAAEGAVS
jgi:CBS domain containing-hemolysin-like protein